MKRFILSSEQIKQNAMRFLQDISIDQNMEVVFQEHEKIRTTPQNSMYWAALDYYLKMITRSVENVAKHTGHTPLDIRRLIAKELDTDQATILFIRSKEAVHDYMKTIFNIPTSTRLGTKKFSQFEEQMEATLSDIVGTINAIAARMMG